jgi:hypothetical protein
VDIRRSWWGDLAFARPWANWRAARSGGGGWREDLLVGVGGRAGGVENAGGRGRRPGIWDLSGVPLFLERPSVAPSRNCWVERAAVFSYSALLTVRQNIVSDFK